MALVAQNSFERIRDALERDGLKYRETRAGVQIQFQTPGHSPNDLGSTCTYTGDRVLLYAHNEPGWDYAEFAQALGLEPADLYDAPATKYEYDGGRVVTRINATKEFRQSGNTKSDTSLYGTRTLTSPGVVYVVEGEKDADTAAKVWGVPAVSQAAGSNQRPDKADWSALAGREVVIIADKDKPGFKRAEAVLDYLTSLPRKQRPESVEIKTAATGKDLSDHIAACGEPDGLESYGQKITKRRVNLTKASTVEAKKVEWVIDQLIPKGMLTLLSGREGIGKSTVACKIVADLTNAGVRCAYLNSEDSRAYTVKPRLQAAGADLDLCHFIDVATETGDDGYLLLPEDTSILFDAFNAAGVQFVVLDAAKSSMNPKLNGYNDDDVRKFLEPLVKQADIYGITILGLVHFGKRDEKDSGKLILGSIAWSQIARSVLSLATYTDKECLVMTNTKANLANRVVSRELKLNTTQIVLDDGEVAPMGVAEFGDETDVIATDLLGGKQDGVDPDALTGAPLWLYKYLTKWGPTARQDVLADAEKHNIGSERTIKRAFAKIGGKADRQGFPAVATWSLPGTSSNPHDTTPGEPTGNDQEQHNEPTGDPAAHKPQQDTTGVVDDTANEIIGLLDATHAMSTQTIKASLTPPQRNDIEDLTAYLNDMQQAGLIKSDARGKWLAA